MRALERSFVIKCALLSLCISFSRYGWIEGNGNLVSVRVREYAFFAWRSRGAVYFLAHAPVRESVAPSVVVGMYLFAPVVYRGNLREVSLPTASRNGERLCPRVRVDKPQLFIFEFQDGGV